MSSFGPHNLITEDHVRAAVKADKGDVQFGSFAIEDFTKKGDNVACFVTCVKVRYWSSGGQEEATSYVVKVNPCRNGGSKSDQSTADGFVKESEFYLQLAPDLNAVLCAAGQKPLRIPKCFYSSLEYRKEIIFLEDLRCRGYQMAERLGGITGPHATLVIKELAKLHAAGYLLLASMTNPMERYESLNNDWAKAEGEQRDLSNKHLAKCNEHSLAILKSIGGYEKAVTWIERYKMESLNLLQELGRSSPPFQVVCHGDIWNNNILFRCDETGMPLDVMFLDFQVPRVSSLATDLDFFLFMSLKSDVRRAHLETILENYYETFNHIIRSGGKKTPFTLSELHVEYQDKHLFGLLYVMFVMPNVMLENSDFPELEDFFRVRTEDEEKEWRRKTLPYILQSPMLQPRFLDVFDDMESAGVF